MMSWSYLKSFVSSEPITSYRLEVISGIEPCATGVAVWYRKSIKVRVIAKVNSSEAKCKWPEDSDKILKLRLMRKDKKDPIAEYKIPMGNLSGESTYQSKGGYQDQQVLVCPIKVEDMILISQETKQAVPLGEGAEYHEFSVRTPPDCADPNVLFRIDLESTKSYTKAHYTLDESAATMTAWFCIRIPTLAITRPLPVARGPVSVELRFKPDSFSGNDRLFLVRCEAPAGASASTAKENIFPPDVAKLVAENPIPPESFFGRRDLAFKDGRPFALTTDKGPQTAITRKLLLPIKPGDADCWGVPGSWYQAGYIVCRADRQLMVVLSEPFQVRMPIVHAITPLDRLSAIIECGCHHLLTDPANANASTHDEPHAIVTGDAIFVQASVSPYFHDTDHLRLVFLDKGGERRVVAEVPLRRTRPTVERADLNRFDNPAPFAFVSREPYADMARNIAEAHKDVDFVDVVSMFAGDQAPTKPGRYCVELVHHGQPVALTPHPFTVTAPSLALEAMVGTPSTSSKALARASKAVARAVHNKVQATPRCWYGVSTDVTVLTSIMAADIRAHKLQIDHAEEQISDPPPSTNRVLQLKNVTVTESGCRVIEAISPDYPGYYTLSYRDGRDNVLTSTALRVKGPKLKWRAEAKTAFWGEIIQLRGVYTPGGGQHTLVLQRLSDGEVQKAVSTPSAFRRLSSFFSGSPSGASASSPDVSTRSRSGSGSEKWEEPAQEWLQCMSQTVPLPAHPAHELAHDFRPQTPGVYRVSCLFKNREIAVSPTITIRGPNVRLLEAGKQDIWWCHQLRVEVDVGESEHTGVRMTLQRLRDNAGTVPSSESRFEDLTSVQKENLAGGSKVLSHKFEPRHSQRPGKYRVAVQVPISPPHWCKRQFCYYSSVVTVRGASMVLEGHEDQPRVTVNMHEPMSVRYVASEAKGAIDRIVVRAGRRRSEDAATHKQAELVYNVKKEKECWRLCAPPFPGQYRVVYSINQEIESTPLAFEVVRPELEVKPWKFASGEFVGLLVSLRTSIFTDKMPDGVPPSERHSHLIAVFPASSPSLVHPVTGTTQPLRVNVHAEKVTRDQPRGSSLWKFKIAFTDEHGTDWRETHFGESKGCYEVRYFASQTEAGYIMNTTNYFLLARSNLIHAEPASKASSAPWVADQQSGLPNGLAFAGHLSTEDEHEPTRVLPPTPWVSAKWSNSCLHLSNDSDESALLQWKEGGDTTREVTMSPRSTRIESVHTPSRFPPRAFYQLRSDGESWHRDDVKPEVSPAVRASLTVARAKSRKMADNINKNRVAKPLTSPITTTTTPITTTNTPVPPPITPAVPPLAPTPPVTQPPPPPAPAPPVTQPPPAPTPPVTQPPPPVTQPPPTPTPTTTIATPPTDDTGNDLMAAIRKKRGRVKKKKRKLKKPAPKPKPLTMAEEMQRRLANRRNALSGSDNKTTKKTAKAKTKVKVKGKRRVRRRKKAEAEAAPAIDLSNQVVNPDTDQWSD